MLRIMMDSFEFCALQQGAAGTQNHDNFRQLLETFQNH
jgi:hypothetical protein